MHGELALTRPSNQRVCFGAYVRTYAVDPYVTSTYVPLSTPIFAFSLFYADLAEQGEAKRSISRRGAGLYHNLQSVIHHAQEQPS